MRSNFPTKRINVRGAWKWDSGMLQFGTQGHRAKLWRPPVTRREHCVTVNMGKVAILVVIRCYREVRGTAASLANDTVSRRPCLQGHRVWWLPDPLNNVR